VVLSEVLALYALYRGRYRESLLEPLDVPARPRHEMPRVFVLKVPKKHGIIGAVQVSTSLH